MINFFRKIRKTILLEGKTIQYLKYAISEIVLVVIGILIALQINNWNENRKALQADKEFYAKMLSDVRFNSKQINEAIEELREHADLHYQLYAESRGKSEYNPEIRYGILRWGVQFKPRLGALYQTQINSASDSTVKDAFSNYLIVEESVKNVYELFENLKKEVVRPYLTQNNLVNTDSIYSEPKYQEVDPMRSVDYEKLKTQFGTAAFDQILYELKVKTASTFDWYMVLSEANKALEETLVKELNSAKYN